MKPWQVLGAALFALSTCACATPGARAQHLALSVNAAQLSMYASVSGVGVFKQSGLNGVWQGPGLLPSSALSLAVSDQAHWRTVYAGLRDGVYVTRDGGITWTATLKGHTVSALAVDAHNANLVLAGTESGLFRSVDGGATWLGPNGATGPISAIAQGPAAGLFYVAGAGRVWVSKDGAQHVTQLGGGLPQHAAVNDLGVTPTQPITVYAATDQGMWQLAGSSWTAITRGLPAHPFAAVVADSTHIFAVDRADPAIFVSLDGGAGWTRRSVSGVSGGITTLVQDPAQPAVLAFGDQGGNVGYSLDAGATWTVSAVAGTVGSPVETLALAQRQTLPVDPVTDPHRTDTQWFPVAGGGGHTLRGAFLAFWQSVPNAASVIGMPLTEEFTDRAHGNATAQVFTRMELLLKDNSVTIAPLGQEQLPARTAQGKPPVEIVPPFQAFWAKYDTAALSLLGPPIAPAVMQSNGDGTGRPYLTQLFRNARLEYHPELAATGSTVLVSTLGFKELQTLGWT